MTQETIATLPGGWDLAHAIRLGIKPFAELGANSEALSGSQVDSPCSCRAIFELAPVAMLQSLTQAEFFSPELDLSASLSLRTGEVKRDITNIDRLGSVNGASLKSTCLTPKPLASSVYLHVPEAPSLTNGRY